jgi:D-tyrosyl-tRNA(Tyr) deacylase
MKLVIQRVLQASVMAVETGVVTGKIGKGLFVLVGVGQNDTKEKAAQLAEKLAKIRLLADAEGKMNLSAENFLVVSQFTLYADTSGGNRPSFLKAAEPQKAQELYEYFVSELKTKGVKVETGSFGKEMQIKALLDGPVTIVLEN